MKALGIDPGLVVTGYGVLHQEGGRVRLLEAGTIDSGDTQAPLEKRLQQLAETLEGVFADHRPDAMALEQLYAHYEHPRTAILMGHARGVICYVAARHDVPVFHYAATQVKSAVTGNGRASKDQIQQMVRRTFGLLETPRPPDVADAVAIAMCHIFHQGTRSAQDYLRLLR